MRQINVLLSRAKIYELALNYGFKHTILIFKHNKEPQYIRTLTLDVPLEKTYRYPIMLKVNITRHFIFTRG